MLRFGFTTYPFMVLFLVGSAAQAADPPRVEKIVNTAIENFEPLWSPPRGQLQGWKIGIDPAGVGASRSGQRICDDLSLLTAAQLYHFVLRAGGSPVLTRADNTRAADPDGTALRQRFDVVRAAGGDLCVSIRYDDTPDDAAVLRAVDARPTDNALANALCAALAVDAAEEGTEPVDDPDLARCEVRFGCPLTDPLVDRQARRACFDNARRLFAGISRYCDSSTKRGDTTAEPAPIPDLPGSEIGTRYQQLARSIWPQGTLPADQLDWFCERFARDSITNRSLVLFDISARLEQDEVVLRGQTNAPSVIAGLMRAIRGAGHKRVRNDVRELPDREHLGEHLFGVCRAPMALTYNRPGTRAGLQTQLLFGEPLFLLDREDEHYLLHAGDGYWGWVHADAVEPLTAKQFDAYLMRASAVAVQDIENDRARIPRGSTVRVAGTEGNEQIILLPDGATLPVPATAVKLLDDEDAVVSRVQAALDLLYVPYVFGGCSPLGLDCSGMVTNVTVRTGGKPSRDAWQQALAGWLVATPWHRTNIRAGDQLFFLNGSGKISHTGLALDATHFIHSAPPCVQIGSFDPEDPLYDAYRTRTFFMAKRP